MHAGAHFPNSFNTHAQDEFALWLVQDSTGSLPPGLLSSAEISLSPGGNKQKESIAISVAGVSWQDNLNAGGHPMFRQVQSWSSYFSGINRYDMAFSGHAATHCLAAEQSGRTSPERIR